MAVTDIIIAKLGTVSAITSEVSGIRPVNASLQDARPYIAVEQVQMTSVLGLNCHTGLYNGKVRVYVCSDTHVECLELAQLAQDALDGYRGTGDVYTLGVCRLDDREDISQTIDAEERPYYVVAMDFTVIAKKNA